MKNRVPRKLKKKYKKLKASIKCTKLPDFFDKDTFIKKWAEYRDAGTFKYTNKFTTI